MKVKKGDTFNLVVRRDGIYNPSFVEVISCGKSPGGRRLTVDELPASYASARDIPVNITTDMSEEQQDEIGEALLTDVAKRIAEDNNRLERQQRMETITKLSNSIDALMLFSKLNSPNPFQLDDACFVLAKTKELVLKLVEQA